MIAALRGTVIGFDDRSVLLDVHGVTFRIQVVPRAERQWSVGSEQHIQTVLHVREDAMELFGFPTQAERRLFERLVSVSGVGPRLALAVLSAGSVSDLESAIERGDAALLTKVSGVGTKTAQRIVVDLRGKLSLDGEGDTSLSSVIDALVGLGYSPREARDAATATVPDAAAEDRVRQALRRLGKQR